MSETNKIPENIAHRSGAGRPKGALNKTTGLLKDAILEAAVNVGNEIGGNGLTSYLEQIARSDFKAYSGLMGKIIPTQLQHSGNISNLALLPDEELERIAAMGKKDG